MIPAEPIRIPECPAYPICRAKGLDCRICVEVSEDRWREHVRKVMGRNCP